MPLTNPAACSAGITPQLAVQQAMAAMSAKAEAMTGISLPKYYNPAAVNPLKYAEQMQKRKLLWKSDSDADKQEVHSFFSLSLYHFIKYKVTTLVRMTTCCFSMLIRYWC